MEFYLKRAQVQTKFLWLTEHKFIRSLKLSKSQRRWNKSIKQMLYEAKGNLWLWETEVHENPFEFISIFLLFLKSSRHFDTVKGNI